MYAATTEWPGVSAPAVADSAVPLAIRGSGGASSPRIAALKSVSLSLGDPAVSILEDVSFDVAPGEALCLVGPSGGGKSTILNLLAGLVAPSSGQVLWDGKAVEGPGPDR